MEDGHLEELAGRRDMVVEYGGAVYCWICYREVLGAPPFFIAGHRLGSEACSSCGHVGTVVVVASQAPPL